MAATETRLWQEHYTDLVPRKRPAVSPQEASNLLSQFVAEVRDCLVMLGDPSTGKATLLSRQVAKGANAEEVTSEVYRKWSDIDYLPVGSSAYRRHYKIALENNDHPRGDMAKRMWKILHKAGPRNKNDALRVSPHIVIVCSPSCTEETPAAEKSSDTQTLPWRCGSDGLGLVDPSEVVVCLDFLTGAEQRAGDAVEPEATDAGPWVPRRGRSSSPTRR